jgi:hypothetical protein
MKFLYIIDYWVPEYKGVINLIASSDKEAFEIISTKKIMDHIGEYYTEIKNDYEYSDIHKRSICKNILSAQRFPLLPSSTGFKEYCSGIVYFISTKTG